MVSVTMPDGLVIEIDPDMVLVNGRNEIETPIGKIYLNIECGISHDEPLYHDVDWLRTEYIGNNRTMADIAKQFGVTPMTIHQWLTKHEIPTRPRGRKREKVIPKNPNFPYNEVRWGDDH